MGISVNGFTTMAWFRFARKIQPAIECQQVGRSLLFWRMGQMSFGVFLRCSVRPLWLASSKSAMRNWRINKQASRVFGHCHCRRVFQSPSYWLDSVMEGQPAVRKGESKSQTIIFTSGYPFVTIRGFHGGGPSNSETDQIRIVPWSCDMVTRFHTNSYYAHNNSIDLSLLRYIQAIYGEDEDSFIPRGRPRKVIWGVSDSEPPGSRQHQSSCHSFVDWFPLF